jgi:alginate O-acetyltransferase complex protein AlgI
MLFNSIPFLFLFLPIALIGYQLLGKLGRRPVIGWLGFMSLVFYGVWRPKFVFLLIGSILLNYLCSLMIARSRESEGAKSTWLFTGVSANLAVLAYFKYLFPFAGFLHAHQWMQADWGHIILPLGISFFTFTQIAYLIDLRQGEAEPQDIVSYTLFVTFFPHLIAGPILHHKEIMPQFQEERRYSLREQDLRIGMSWFILGLGKKVIIADHLSLFADSTFANVHGLSAISSWVGVLSYSMQLYFDFSGYSDMAIGLARMFSIEFPLNFNSPYKATNIIDFWQRWHMTLTRYLTLYLYNPLAMNVRRRRMAAGKKVSSKATRTLAGFTSMIAAPTIITMFLAGVWHGAGFQFLIFGLLHGVYISANHAWRVFRTSPAQPSSGFAKSCATAGSWLLTYTCVLVGQIFFRANSTSDALSLLSHLGGVHGIGHLAPFIGRLAFIAVLFPAVWLLPNTQQIMGYVHPAEGAHSNVPSWLQWRPTFAWSLSLGVVSFISIMYLFDSTSFLYFQF